MKIMIEDPLGKNRKLVIGLFSVVGLIVILALTPKPETVEDTFHRATDAFHRGDFQKSVELYDQVLENNPTIASAFQNRTP